VHGIRANGQAPQPTSMSCSLHNARCTHSRLNEPPPPPPDVRGHGIIHLSPAVHHAGRGVGQDDGAIKAAVGHHARVAPGLQGGRGPGRGGTERRFVQRIPCCEGAGCWASAQARQGAIGILNAPCARPAWRTRPPVSDSTCPSTIHPPTHLAPACPAHLGAGVAALLLDHRQALGALILLPGGIHGHIKHGGAGRGQALCHLAAA